MKNQIVLFFLCFVFTSDGKKLFEKDDIKKYLNSMQLIKLFGYPAEAHTVETLDGYLLQMHRIPHGRHKNASDSTKLPVLIQHGFLSSSADFLHLGPESGLPFLLADSGYDVWFGNLRGNTYSRAHRTFSTKTLNFWDFTWHESAIYDLPAQINFICEHTKQDKVIYIGYSMGTTVFFVLASTLPEYDKIEVSLNLAPVAYSENIKGVAFRLAAPFEKQIEQIFNLFEHGGFFYQSDTYKSLLKLFCEVANIKKSLCKSFMFMEMGDDEAQLNYDVLDVFANHFPAGYSVKAYSHYLQLKKSGEFRQFDYGEDKNMLHYGTPEPPSYNVSNIKIPMYFYEGQNDFLSVQLDVKRLTNQLSTLRKEMIVDHPKFSHADFVISKDVKKLLYDHVMQDLNDYFNEKNNQKCPK